jgi:hypothetical protein
MRLFSAKIPHITEVVTRTLIDAGDLEISDREEFKRDIEAILKEYLRKDRELTEAAKDLLEARGLPYSDLYKLKRQLAEREEFAIGEESVEVWSRVVDRPCTIRRLPPPTCFFPDELRRRTSPRRGRAGAVDGHRVDATALVLAAAA